MGLIPKTTILNKVKTDKKIKAGPTLKTYKRNNCPGNEFIWQLYFSTFGRTLEQINSKRSTEH